MAEETMTTESTDSPQTEQNSGSVLGSESVGDNQDWRNTLPEDLKNDPTLQNYKDVASLAKTVVHQQQMIGNRIPLPKTEEEKAELYGKLGRPDVPEKYEVNVIRLKYDVCRWTNQGIACITNPINRDGGFEKYL